MESINAKTFFTIESPPSKILPKIGFYHAKSLLTYTVFLVKSRKKCKVPYFFRSNTFAAMITKTREVTMITERSRPRGKS